MKTIHRIISYAQNVVKTRQSCDQTSQLLLNSSFFYHACATPLTSLISNIDLALENDSGRQSVYLKRSLIAASQIKDLLQHLQPRKCNKEPFLVRKAIQETINFLNQNSSSDIRVHYYISRLTRLTGYRLYFQQSLSCLITNAIEAYSSRESHKSVLVVVRNSDAHLRIDVVDFAHGMTYIDQKRATHRGVTYKTDGTGLGLYFVKESIEKLFNGKLEVFSQLGKGTQIRLFIPFSPAADSQNPSQFELSPIENQG